MIKSRFILLISIVIVHLSVFLKSAPYTSNMVPWRNNTGVTNFGEIEDVTDFSMLLGCMNTVDYFENQTLPNVIKQCKKMISTSHQYHFLTASRHQGTVPKGIAKQSVFRYSVDGSPLQSQLQSLYNFTASRALDLMITETHNRVKKQRSVYYSSLGKARSLAQDLYYDMTGFEREITKTISTTKMECIDRHKKKLSRDLKSFKIYMNLEGNTQGTGNDQPDNIEAQNSTTATYVTKKKKKCRRFQRHKNPNDNNVPVTENQILPKNNTIKTRNNGSTCRSRRNKLKSSAISIIPAPTDTNKYFHNLTSMVLTEAQKSILALGSKFCPTPTTSDRAQFETDIENWAHKMRWPVKIETYDTNQPKPIPSPGNVLERQLIKKALTTPIINSGKPGLEIFIQKVREDLLINPSLPKNVYSNLTPDQNSALREMRCWETDYGIIFRPYDKGEGMFLDYVDSYESRVLAQLNSTNYVMITNKSDLRNTIIAVISNWCDRWSSEPLLTAKIMEWVTPDATKKPGKFYLNYKKHKPEKNFPGRLITSGCGSFTENLSLLTALELKKRAHQLPYVIQDTNALLCKLDEINTSKILHTGNKIIHASFDVISMFPNMHKNLGITRCREELQLRVDGLPTQCVLEALEITLDYNVAEFDGVWYRQVTGAAMGPHNSCEYCDLGMSFIDNMVNSDKNPYKSFVNEWIRFRDDIYCPWTQGEESLLQFFNWLNTLDSNIKFTISYAEEGIEFLDTYIYDRGGTLHTKLYSKDSDTFAYLPPHSCHPYHICKNNPDQIARRVYKINSEVESYEAAKIVFSDHLISRGYANEPVKNAFEKYENSNREVLYHTKKEPNNEPEQKQRCYPLVTEFNPHLPKVAPVLQKHKYLLALDPEVSKVVPPDSVFASFRQPKSIGNMLTRSTFKSSRNREAPTSSGRNALGCHRCIKSCHLCKRFLIPTKTFKSYSCKEMYTIKQDLNCQSEGIIYLLNDVKCLRSYVGSTISSMSKRFSNYKSHIKTSFEGCEIASHFSSKRDVHDIDFSGTAEQYAQRLAEHINIIIIDQVSLTECKTTKEKRAKIEIVEGQWQTNLRTLIRYGGLNKKDERKISNNRSARKRT